MVMVVVVVVQGGDGTVGARAGQAAADAWGWGEMVMMRTDTSHMRPPLTMQGSPAVCPAASLCTHTHSHAHGQINAHKQVILAQT